MIKKENGSALLTVILIVFVTVTIGSAISSFIMMNNKLRTIDKNIGIAEYEAETIQTYAYAAVIDKMKDIIENADSYANASTNTACNQANSDVAGNNFSAELVPALEGWVAEDVSEKVTDNSASTKPGIEPKLKKEYFKQSFDEQIEDVFNESDSDKFFRIGDKLSSQYTKIECTYDENVFNEYFIERFDGVGVYFKRISGSNNFTLKIYYKKKDVTPVYLNGDFIIRTPEYKLGTNQTIQDKYNTIDYVGITNVEFKDWGI